MMTFQKKKVCPYIHVWRHAWKHAYIHTCIYTYTYAYCMYVHIYTYMQTNIHTCKTETGYITQCCERHGNHIGQLSGLYAVEIYTCIDMIVTRDSTNRHKDNTVDGSHRDRYQQTTNRHKDNTVVIILFVLQDLLKLSTDACARKSTEVTDSHRHAFGN